MSIADLRKFSLIRTAWQRSFFVTLFFVTFAALLFWLDGFRTYQSEIRVLIIGKVPTVATDQVVENFAELSQNLSFYERVLERSDLIDDDFEGYSKDRRKELWNKAVQVTRSENSGVLSVRAKQDSPEKAKRLSEETVQTLFSVASFYYDIKTDLDLRIVDGPILKTVVARPIAYVLTSFGSALAVTAMFFVVLSSLPGLFGKRAESASREYPIGESVPFIDPQKFIPARPTSLSFESSHDSQEELVEKVVASKVVSSEKMLPGMDAQSLPFRFEESFPDERQEGIEGEVSLTDLPVTGGFLMDKDVSAKTETKEEAPVKTGEPTVEEYKRRLNELLSGGR